MVKVQPQCHSMATNRLKTSGGGGAAGDTPPAPAPPGPRKAFGAVGQRVLPLPSSPGRAAPLGPRGLSMGSFKFS